MNKKLVGVFVLLLIIIAAVAFFVIKKPSLQTSSSQPVSTNTASSENNIQGTLKNLLTGGKSVKCTFSETSGSASVDGTVYVANGKMRGDFKTSSPDTSTNGHIIVDAQNSYMWTDASNQGFKFAVNAGETSSPSAQSGGVDLNQPVNYSCENWSPDNSLFSLPSNVTFSALSIPTNPAGGTSKPSGDGSTSQCAVCNNLPAGSAKDACLAQLNCK